MINKIKRVVQLKFSPYKKNEKKNKIKGES